MSEILEQQECCRHKHRENAEYESLIKRLKRIDI